MTVGELVVNLGVKGSDKAMNALSSIKSGLSELASGGLAAKAALIGVAYALESMISSSIAKGTSLNQFSRYTGLSTDSLQRWQYAMRQAGVASEETQNNIQAVQATMGKMLLGEGAPKGFSFVNSSVGLDFDKLKETNYVISKLRDYLHKDKNITRANEAAASFGLTPAMIQALRSSFLDLSKIPKYEILSQKSVDRLDHANIALTNFKQLLTLKKDAFVSKYAIDAIKAAVNAINLLTSTAKNVAAFTHEFAVLKSVAVAAGLAIATAFAPITTIVSGIVLLMSEIQKFREGKVSIFGDNGILPDWMKSGSKMMDYVGGFSDHNIGTDLKKLYNGMMGGGGIPSGWHAPQLLPRSGVGGTGDKTTSMNTTINNYGVEGASEIGQNFNTAVNFALRQMQAVTQVA